MIDNETMEALFRMAVTCVGLFFVLQGATHAQPILVRHDGKAVGNGHAFVRGETCFVVTANHVVPHGSDFDVVDRRSTVASAKVVKRFRDERSVDPQRPGDLAHIDVLLARVDKRASFICNATWDASSEPKDALAKAQSANAELTAHHTNDDGSAATQLLRFRNSTDERLDLSPSGSSDVFSRGHSGSFVTVRVDNAPVLVGMIIQADRGKRLVIALTQPWLNSLLAGVLNKLGVPIPPTASATAQTDFTATIPRAQNSRPQASGKITLNQVADAGAALDELGFKDASTARLWTPLIEHASQVYAAARSYKSGRIVAIGHHATLSHGSAENHSFLRSTFEWLNGGSATRSVALVTAYCATDRDYPELRRLLDKWEFRSSLVLGPVNDDKLADAKVVVINNVWGTLTKAEIDSVERFVARGGGLIATGLGWAWRDYSSKSTHRCAGTDYSEQVTSDLSTFPMNKLFEPFGLQWTGVIIDRR